MVKTVLDTLFYYVELCFALRGGEEHRQLRHMPSQISLFESPNGRRYLVYEEDVSKTNQGGLLHRDRTPKKVVHYQNEDCTERCLVWLYKLYNSKCPDDRPKDAFYLKPLKCLKGAVWYQLSAIGHNILSKMVSRIMAKSGIEERYSNHSLRSTATSSLFHAGLDEQLIMLRTGHSSSTNGVRTYKCANEQQLEETSNIQ